MYFIYSRPMILAAIVCLSAVNFLTASAKLDFAQDQGQATSAEAGLSEEQKREFLLTAKIVSGRQTGKGITRPFRLTLSDGNLIHDAGFQSIDEFQMIKRLSSGTTEINFRDSYHFNIAAYELAKLLGLEHMMPVTVERSYQGNKGSLTWWLKVKMDEAERLTQKIVPPDVDAHNKQIYKVRVFSQLVYDTDRNLTNVLIGENWELYMIDFSRAFRLHKQLKDPDELLYCDRQLLEKLQQLDAAELERKTESHLRKPEIEALMARRDQIVAHFQQLIAEKGEKEVLY